MPWLQRSPSDLNAVQAKVFSLMTSSVPAIRYWFGVAVKRVAPGNKALSTASAVYISISKAISDWVHAIYEVKQSMFIDPPQSFGNRWVEHVRSIYSDYGLQSSPNYKENWQKSIDETQEQYDARLSGYASYLKQLFNKPAVTKENIANAIRSIVGSRSQVSVKDASSFIIPYPGPTQYKPHKLSQETDSEFITRSELYVDSNFNKLRNGLSRSSNSSYVAFPEEVFSYNGYTETPAIRDERLALLKSNLGSYTKDLDLSNRKYFSSLNQGGTIVIEILDAQNSEYLSTVLDKVYEAKAAGVRVYLNLHFYLGTATKGVARLPAVTTKSVSKTVVLTVTKTFTNLVFVSNQSVSIIGG